MQIKLTVVKGPHEGKEFSFERHDTFIVGRGKQSHFRLPKLDGYFSRTHFMLETNPPNCVLLDLDSTNGTFVNGARVKQAYLQDGDLIHGGDTEIRVAIETADGSTDAAMVLERGAAEPAVGVATPVAPATGGQPVAISEVAPTRSLPPRVDQKADARPQRFPGYTIIKEIGGGAMGMVYLACDEASGRQVALKTIKPAVVGNAANCMRFVREANILRENRHPHIVAFEDMGYVDGTMYFVMEYVPGTDAEKMLKEHGRLPIGQAVRIVCQALEGLTDAHSRGFVHRDVKPANLLVTTCDGRPLVKLADFGLARMYHASQLSGLTMMGDTGGTIAYMAPEQITNYRESKPAVDQYSAAATLYHLLTGRFIYNFPKEYNRKLLMVLQEDAVPIQRRGVNLPPDLATAIHCALARDPANRFADCMMFRQALLPFYNAPSC